MGWVLQRTGASRRATVDAMGHEAMAALAGYVRGTAFVAFVDAGFIGVGFWVLGVSLVLPIARLTFFASLQAPPCLRPSSSPARADGRPSSA